MAKLLALALLCLVALLPLDVRAQVMPYGTKATFHQHHATLGNGLPDDRSGWVYSFPVKVQTKPAVHLHKRAAVRRTHRNAPHARQKSAKRAPHPVAGGYTILLHVTGYSYTPQCGDVNGITADGSIPTPYYTVASSIPALWHHHIYIASLGFHGYVQDTGAPLDLFMPTCASTYAVTGWRLVTVF